MESIPEQDLIARADPEDADGDGISGRTRMVWSPELEREALGRFSWKASAATVMDQSAAAFSGDMGLSTLFHPKGWGECSPAQSACRAAVDGGSPEHGGVEVGAEALDLVTFYARNLAVPARRNVGDPEVLRGKQVFYASGCAACHTPKHVTHRFPAEGEDGKAGAELSVNLALHRPAAARPWARGWRMAGPRAAPAAANGAPRRYGASG